MEEEEVFVEDVEDKQFLELMVALKELPTEKINQIALQMLYDPVLVDVKSEKIDELTDYDIDKIIAIETGNAVQIFLKKQTGERIAFTITPDTTLDLFRKDVKKVISSIEEKKMGSRRISWTYVWKNYCLMYENTRLLTPEFSLMNHYGVKPGSELTFAKYKVKFPDS